MASGGKHGASWLAAPSVSWRWFAGTVLVWAIVLVGVFRSEAGPYLESRLARPVDFQVRELLGKGPVLSSKLKIYSFDDTTFAQLARPGLATDEWVELFELIDANEPRAIVVDKMFSKSDGLEGINPEVIARLSRVRTPVVVGAFVSAQPIRYREPLDLVKPDYSLSVMLGKPQAEAPQEGPPAALLPPMTERREWYAYGPSKELETVFRHIGHILYTGYGVVSPIVRLGADVALPHIGTFVGRERKIEGRRFVLDGTQVPVDLDGNLVVNLTDPDKLYDATRSMRGLLNLLKDDERSKVIQKDDVVLILPSMFTGHTDFKATPFGTIPGGFIVAATINSVLTGQWLKPLTHGEALTVFGVMVGAVVGMKCGVILFWFALLFGTLSGAGLSQWLFSYQGVVVPWLFPVLGFMVSGLTVFAEKVRATERKAQKLRQALEGSVAPGELKELMKRPEVISFEARERVVSLMFIDVVGFSLLAENMLPRMAFENLKKMLSTIGDTIHAFGGIIDKTLGDGLLCYFGYRFDQDSSSPDHAEQALRCAIAIQEANLRKNLEASSNGEPVYPLRIGINTASCYLGDLGNESRIDFTVVGNGVNFAKRLEGACDMHSVLIGATSYDLVKGIGLPVQGFTKRFIRIKHHSELVEAYEYDPFHAAEGPELRAAALEGFRKCANIDRIDQRWPVHDPSKIQLECDFGEGQLVNFSHTGFSIRLKQLLAKGTRLNIVIDGGSGSLRRLLAKEGIDILQGEVRWGYADGGNFTHGVMITNLEGEKSDYLVQYLCEFAFTKDVQADKRAKGEAQVDAAKDDTEKAS